jgi:rod shape-determining protein MreD
VILTARTNVRLLLLGILTVIVQLSFFAKLSFIGTSPDVTPVLVTSLAILGGSVAGAVAGFSIGLLLDALMLQTMGASSLSLLAVGYLAGRYRESIGQPTRGALVLLAGGLTLLGVTMFAIIQVMLGVGSDVSGLIVRDAILKSLMAMAMIIPVHAGVRRLLRPAVVEDRPRASRPISPRPTRPVGTS